MQDTQLVVNIEHDTYDFLYMLGVYRKMHPACFVQIVMKLISQIHLHKTKKWSEALTRKSEFQQIDSIDKKVQTSNSW